MSKTSISPAFESSPLTTTPTRGRSCPRRWKRLVRASAVDSVQHALEAVESSHPDVLIADIGIAGADGFELISRVRESADPAVRDIPAAALTAYARAEDRMKSLQSGFQIHLAKPVDPAELVVAVAALAKRIRRWPE